MPEAQILPSFLWNDPGGDDDEGLWVLLVQQKDMWGLETLQSSSSAGHALTPLCRLNFFNPCGRFIVPSLKRSPRDRRPSLQGSAGTVWSPLATARTCGGCFQGPKAARQ